MKNKDTESSEGKIPSVSIVRFISAQNEANILRRALTQHFYPSEVVDNLDDHDNAVTLLSLSNKYFNAQVQFLDIGETFTDESSSYKTFEDGIILTFQDSITHDKNMTEAFDALDSIHSLAQSIQQCGDKLRLCVGIYHTDNTSHTIDEAVYEDEYQRRILWCLDRGYEYVQADMSEEGRKKGHTDREKEGYARILEAFQATLWSSAIRAEPTKSNEDNKYKSEGPQVDDSRTKMSNTHPNEEAYFDNLDQVMREAVRIRDDARSGTLTDEERRKRAGNAAMALMGLLEQMGLDEEEEDSEVESN